MILTNEILNVILIRILGSTYANDGHERERSLVYTMKMFTQSELKDTSISQIAYELCPSPGHSPHVR